MHLQHSHDCTSRRHVYYFSKGRVKYQIGGFVIQMVSNYKTPPCLQTRSRPSMSSFNQRPSLDQKLGSLEVQKNILLTELLDACPELRRGLSPHENLQGSVKPSSESHVSTATTFQPFTPDTSHTVTALLYSPPPPPLSRDRSNRILSHAQKINQDHIRLLNRYNEIKDVGQGLMGLLAEHRGVRLIDAMDEFGIGAEDQ